MPRGLLKLTWLETKIFAREPLGFDRDRSRVPVGFFVKSCSAAIFSQPNRAGIAE